jgi:hypothetical protein
MQGERMGRLLNATPRQTGFIRWALKEDRRCWINFDEENMAIPSPSRLRE